MAVSGLEARLGGDQRAVRRVQPLLVGRRRRRRRERLLRLLLFLLPRELRAKKPHSLEFTVRYDVIRE